MANIKITDLTAYGDPTSTDVLPIVDVGADVTKKVSIADLLENAGSGTEALPGIAFDGDPDTGIYRPDADQLAISTNGTGRLFIDASGNVEAGNQRFYVDNTNGRVGILTSSPQKTLEIAAASDPTLRFNDLRGYTTDLKQAGSIFSIINNNPTAPILLGTNGIEKLRITSDGKVGLGTSSPRSLLHVQGGDVVLDTVLGTSSATLDVVSNVTTNNGQDAAPGIAFRAPFASDPARPTYAAIWSKKENNAQGVQIGALVFGTNAGAFTGVTEKLRITSTGNVGIGVTAPGDKLEIGGAGAGIILASPDGTRYRLTVANGGTLSITAV